MSDNNTNFQAANVSNNYQTYTYYTTTSFPPGNGEQHTILASSTDAPGSFSIDDKKYIPLNILTIPSNSTTTTLNQTLPTSNFLVNYGLVPSAITNATESKPVVVNVTTTTEPITTNLGEPSNSSVSNIVSATTVPKKKARSRTSDVVKVKIEQLKPRKGRKQKIPGQTREERKHKANTNRPYINSKGVEVQPRVFDEDFDCECPRRCTSKISVQARKGIFSMYWRMGSFEARCCFINSCVNESPKKRQTTKEPNKRMNSRKYYLKGQEVCKKTFCNTLKISGRTVDGSLLKAQLDDYSDMRGKAKKPNALTQEKIDEVVNHVNSFPTSGKHLIDSTLTLKKMYELYKLNQENPVSESSYKNVFYRHFKLRFEKVKKESS